MKAIDGEALEQKLCHYAELAKDETFADGIYKAVQILRTMPEIKIEEKKEKGLFGCLG